MNSQTVGKILFACFTTLVVGLISGAMIERRNTAQQWQAKCVHAGHAEYFRDDITSPLKWRFIANDAQCNTCDER